MYARHDRGKKFLHRLRGIELLPALPPRRGIAIICATKINELQN